MVCYKVTSDKMTSATIQHGWRINYHIGIWVSAYIGKIFVFSQLEQAVRFGSVLGRRVFIAEASDLEKPPDKILRFPSAMNVVKFWDNLGEMDTTDLILRGTMLCDRVKLVSEVVGL